MGVLANAIRASAVGCKNCAHGWPMIYVDTSILSRLTDYQKSGSTHLSQQDAEALEWLAEQRNLAW